jgi:hypothetical protein
MKIKRMGYSISIAFLSRHSLSLYLRTYVSFLGFLSISLRSVVELVAMFPINAGAETP